MKRIVLIIVLVVTAMAGPAQSCIDECDPNSTCSDFFIPCQAPEFIDQVYGPRSNFRLLVGAYAPLKQETAARMPWKDQREEFRGYEQRIRQMLESRKLAPVPLKHEYAYVYGAHPCLSNNYENALALMETTAGDPRAQTFLRDIVIVRDRILHLCVQPVRGDTGMDPQEALAGLERQAGAAEYAQYLRGLAAFYTGNYRKALESFEGLGSASVPWIRETALYLVGRTHLVLSQEKWSGWGTVDTVDREALNSAEAAYRNYLSRYPAGRYSTSALNIRRRIMFLRKNTDQLNAELERLFEAALAERNEEKLLPITNEVLNFYHAEKISFVSPLIAAYQLFQGTVPGQEDLAFLRKNAAKYAKYPGLHALLVAETLVLQKKYQEAADMPDPADSAIPAVVATALRTLRAEAQERLGNYAGARAVWKRAAGPAGGNEYAHFFQMSLAHNYLKDGKIDQIALDGSSVTDERLLREIFETLATDSLLESIIFFPKTQEKARSLAQTALLNRMVLQKRYADLLRVVNKVKDPGIYSQIETAARTLVEKEDDPKALLNAGYFIYYNGIHPPACWKTDLARQYRASYPVALDPGSLKAPIEYFTTALAQFREDDRSEVEAKLLHYAIISFKPSNKAMDSTWNYRHPAASRGKEWFDRLHRKYPDSEWAKKTKYYYDGK